MIEQFASESIYNKLSLLNYILIIAALNISCTIKFSSFKRKYYYTHSTICFFSLDISTFVLSWSLVSHFSLHKKKVQLIISREFVSGKFEKANLVVIFKHSFQSEFNVSPVNISVEVSLNIPVKVYSK